MPSELVEPGKVKLFSVRLFRNFHLRKIIFCHRYKLKTIEVALYSRGGVTIILANKHEYKREKQNKKIVPNRKLTPQQIQLIQKRRLQKKLEQQLPIQSNVIKENNELAIRLIDSYLAFKNRRKINPTIASNQIERDLIIEHNFNIANEPQSSLLDKVARIKHLSSDIYPPLPP